MVYEMDQPIRIFVSHRMFPKKLPIEQIAQTISPKYSIKQEHIHSSSYISQTWFIWKYLSVLFLEASVIVGQEL